MIDPLQLGDGLLLQLGSDPLLRLGGDPLLRLGSDPLLRPGSDSLLRLGGDPLLRLGSDPLLQLGGDPLATLRTVAIVGCVLAGLFFTLVSTTGVLRLPDVYARAHTASQADTLGAGFALAAVALSLGWGPTAVKAVLLLFFIFVTNPTAAHAIARAAHEDGIEPWTVSDDRTDQDLLAEADEPGATDGGEPQ